MHIACPLCPLQGTNQTRITTWLDGFFGGQQGKQPQQEPQQQAAQGSSAASEQQ